MKTIREKKEALELIIKNAYNAISELQQRCDHSGELTYMYVGGGDGLSRHEDDYWMEWHCQDCSKRWTTTQDNAYELTTRVYPNSKQVRK